MRHFLTTLTVLLLFSTAVPTAMAEVYRYFDEVRGITNAPENHCIRVVSLQEVPPFGTDMMTGEKITFDGLHLRDRRDSPAQRAGLRKDDMIIGLDGLRVRDRREYDLVRFLYDQRSTLELTIVRGGKIMNITVRDPEPVRCARSVHTDQADDFLQTLQGWKINLKELLGHEPVRIEQEKETGAVADLLEQFEAQSSLCITPEIAALYAFPARGREAISLLAKRNNPGDREWVADLLKVYHHLLWERYDEAAKLVAGKKLDAKRVDSFLNRVLEFYKALIANKVSAETGVPLDKYAVDIPFFALCYPYPLAPEKWVSSFSSDPEFQTLFNKATSGRGGLYRDELRLVTGHADGWTEGFPLNRKIKSEVDTFINRVKASILYLPETYGSSPMYYYEYLGGGKEWQQSLTAGLVERLAKKPEDQVVTSLALMSVTCKGDQEVFRKAYETAFKAGSREAAWANVLADGIMQHHNSRIVPFRSMIQSSEANMPKPAFYQHLRRVSPIFNYRAAGGCFRVDGTCLQDLGAYCFAHPHIVAKALDEPLDTNRVDKVTSEASLQNDPVAVERAVRLLAADLASFPKGDRLSALLGLHRKAGAGRILDALNYILGYESTMDRRMFLTTGVNICGTSCGFFREIEKAHYEDIAKELRTLDDRDPKLPQIIAKHCEKAGVPSVCLMLSNKLRQAGYNDLAASYAARVCDYYELGTWIYASIIPNIVPPAYHDLTSVPGFEKFARQYLRDVSVKTDTHYMLYAILDSYEGNIESLVGNLAKADGSATRKDRNQVVYDGSVFASAHDAGVRLAKNLAAGGKLSAQQSDRLKSTSFYVEALKLAGDTTAVAQLQNMEKQVVEKRDVNQMLKLVESYERDRDYAKVAELYRKVVEVMPEVENYKKLVSAQKSAKAYDEQIKTILELNGKFPGEDAYCFPLLVEAYKNNKQNDKIVEMAERRFKANPREAARHYDLALALRAVGREADAVKAIKSGLEIDLDARSIERQRLELAGLYLALKQYDDAEKIARKILAQAPSEETERVAKQLLEKIRRDSERKTP